MDLLPDMATMPNGWLKIDQRADGARYTHVRGLRVMITAAIEADDRAWLHVSLSRKNRLPSYDDMVLVKQLFIGPDKLALQLFVPEDQHVNECEFCLHLWHCLDGLDLPDFRYEGQI